MDLLREALRENHVWWRVADPAWSDPLDASFAGRHGGRWNPPQSFPVLYLNEDGMTARLNLLAFIADWPYEPEDLRDDTGPVLVGCTLPSRQTACDAHTDAGLCAAGLPPTYPLDETGRVVPHARCQPIGVRARAASLRGIRARSARSRDGAGRELAWFPAAIRSKARPVATLAFSEWFWSRADLPGTTDRGAPQLRPSPRGAGHPPGGLRLAPCGPGRNRGGAPTRSA